MYDRDFFEAAERLQNGIQALAHHAGEVLPQIEDTICSQADVQDSRATRKARALARPRADHRGDPASALRPGRSDPRPGRPAILPECRDERRGVRLGPFLRGGPPSLPSRWPRPRTQMPRRPARDPGGSRRSGTRDLSRNRPKSPSLTTRRTTRRLASNDRTRPNGSSRTRTTAMRRLASDHRARCNRSSRTKAASTFGGGSVRSCAPAAAVRRAENQPSANGSTKAARRLEDNGSLEYQQRQRLSSKRGSMEQRFAGW
jgi:hypothetical protein